MRNASRHDALPPTCLNENSVVRMISLRTLGAVGVHRIDNGTRTAIPVQPKRLAVLAYLAAENGRSHRRDTLLSLFWPTMDTSRARRALSQTLYSLRRDLGPDLLLSHGNEEVSLHPERLWCDAAAFGERIDTGDLEEALKLYRGDFLPGLHVSDAREFEEWVHRIRTAHREKAVDAAFELADERKRAADERGRINWLRRALEMSPASETALRNLMAALEAAGEPARALRAYESFTDRLRRDYGLHPGEETVTLADRIQRSAEAGAARLRANETASFASREIRSIAVLPLRDLTPSGEEAFLADGIAEALTMALGRVRALRVISYQSVIRFRGSDEPLGVIASELGVEGLLQGSVMRSDDGVRVALQFSRAEPEALLWSETFECDIGSLEAMYESVRQAIHTTLPADAQEAGEVRAPRSHRTDPETYESYLKGLYFAFMLPDMEKGVRHLRHAIERDPHFAPAHANLAIMAAHRSVFLHLPPDRCRVDLETSAERAFELDDSLPEAHIARALGQLLFEYDWSATLDSFRRAIELNPSHSRARTYCGVFLVAMGWTETAIEYSQEGVRLSPLDPAALWLLGWTLLKALRFEAARRKLESVLEVHPQFELALPFLAEVHLHLGDTEKARSWATRAVERAAEDQLVAGRAGAVLALAGERDDALRVRRALESRSRDRYVDPYYLAILSSALDDPDVAARMWDEAVASRTPSAYCLRAEALTRRVQDHRHFRAVLSSLAFPDLKRRPSPFPS